MFEITPLEAFGNYINGGLGTCANGRSELFVNGQVQTVARYPNMNASTSLPTWTQIKNVTTALEFEYDTDRINRWASEVSEGHVWLHGYWKYGWADNFVRAAGVNTTAGTITISPKTPPVYALEPKARFYGVNIYSELDSPGEYFINTTSGDLFWWPPADLDLNAATISISGVDQPVITMNNVEHVIFRNLRVQHSLQAGVVASGVSNVVLDRLDLSNNGGSGLHVTGINTTVSNCTVRDAGCAAMSVGGGEETSLTPSGNVVSHNLVSGYARVKRTYQAGIGFSGVGHRFDHNRLSNSPHTGFIGSCNDCVFEYNYIDRMCYEVCIAS